MSGTVTAFAVEKENSHFCRSWGPIAHLSTLAPVRSRVNIAHRQIFLWARQTAVTCSYRILACDQPSRSTCAENTLQDINSAVRLLLCPFFVCAHQISSSPDPSPVAKPGPQRTTVSFCCTSLRSCTGTCGIDLSKIYWWLERIWSKGTGSF